MFISGKHRYLLALLGIIVFASGLRLYCFKGFIGLDDAEYTKFAYQIATDQYEEGTYQGPAVFPRRVGIIYPTAFILNLFGVSEWSIAIFPMIISILSLLLCFACTALFFGEKAGLASAALWAVLPLDVGSATILLPDLPAAFFASLGIFLVVLLYRSKVSSISLLLLCGALAGLSFGLSWLCKESLFFFLPFCLILFYIGFRENPRRTIFLWSGVALTSLSILFLEAVAYHNMTGDLFFRFHEIERNYSQWSNGFFTEGSKFGWAVGESRLKAVLKRIFLTGPETIFLNGTFLILPFTGLLATFYAIYWKDDAFLLPSLWFMTLCFMFNFSSSSLTTYTPLALFERYLYPIVLPATVVTSGMLGRLLFPDLPAPGSEARRERMFWGITLAVILTLIGGYSSFRSVRDHWRVEGWMAEVREASEIVPHDRKVYTDTIGKKGMEFFLKYADVNRIVDFEGMTSGRIPSGSFVLTNKRYAEWLDINAGMWLSGPSGYRDPDFFIHPPSTWEIVFRSSYATLYRVP